MRVAHLRALFQHQLAENGGWKEPDTQPKKSAKQSGATSGHANKAVPKATTKKRAETASKTKKAKEETHTLDANEKEIDGGSLMEGAVTGLASNLHWRKPTFNKPLVGQITAASCKFITPRIHPMLGAAPIWACNQRNPTTTFHAKECNSV